MRAHYLKEIQHLRAVEEVQFQNKNLKTKHIKPIETKDYLEVYFFSPTDGLDEETCKIFNNFLGKLKNEFESKLKVMNNINTELARKVAIIDESKKISEMNSEELIELTFTKEKD